MKERTYKMFVEDILDAMNKIERFISGLTYELFEANEMAIDAVIRNFEIIGEASTHIPDEIREKHPDIPWKRMIGLRNIVIHDYFGIDLDTIWMIASKNIPETKPLIVAMCTLLGEKNC